VPGTKQLDYFGADFFGAGHFTSLPSTLTTSPAWMFTGIHKRGQHIALVTASRINIQCSKELIAKIPRRLHFFHQCASSNGIPSASQPLK
jgi:hypothetical protein